MSADVGGSGGGPPRRRFEDPAAYEEVAVVDLLDRLLDRGVVIAGDITLAVADVDLVYLGLRVLLSSASTAERFGAPVPSSTALHRTALGANATAGPAAGGDATADRQPQAAAHASATDDDARSGEAFGDADDALDLDLGFPTVGVEDLREDEQDER